MAVTTFASNDALTNRLWSRKLAVEVTKATPIAALIGTGPNSIIQLKDETQKGKGDQVTFGLRRQLIGAGVTENQVLEGNEEALTTYSDSIIINELAHAVRVRNTQTIDSQRVMFNMREEANDGLVDWYADRMSLAFFLHVGGYTASTIDFEGRTLPIVGKPVYYGNNALIAPSRQVWAGTATNDQTLGVSDTFNLTLIDKAVERAKLANPKIRPVRVDGADKYVMYLHPTQVTSLRTNTSTGQWLDITKAVYQGSRQNNPIYSGALGEYNGVVLREAEHVVPGVNSSTNAQINTVRRAVLLGAQAAVAAFGNDRGPERYKRVEELFDYQREMGVSVQTVWGMKKTVFNSLDFGVVVVSTYAAAA